MKISPVNASMQNYQLRRTNVATQPNFKGWGGALGTIVGAGAGVGLTILSGGALAWTIPALGGVGGIGGDMAQNKANPTSSRDYPDYDDYNGFDFIG